MKLHDIKISQQQAVEWSSQLMIAWLRYRGYTITEPTAKKTPKP